MTSDSRREKKEAVTKLHASQYGHPVTVLVIIICIAAAAAASIGIFSEAGPGRSTYESIRGEEVLIYGEGIYQHMSEEVAVQGIGQDYITLFVGVPLLIISLLWARRGSLRGKYLLTGTLGYFLVGYLFYLIMAMYNYLFLVYTLLTGCAFFAFLLSSLSFSADELMSHIDDRFPRRYLGVFLLVNAGAIALLWLGVVLPPLIDGSIFPVELEHYTTLIVQGMDLGLLLPLAVVIGVLLLRRRPGGYLFGPVYAVFLTLQMLALTAKIIAMGMTGYPVIPAVFIIPTFLILAAVGTVRSLLAVR